jgi:hypothetical protein
MARTATATAHATCSRRAWRRLLVALVLIGCGNQPKEHTLRVSTRALAGCPLDRDVAARATLELAPLGDFSLESARPASVPLLAASELELPPTTRAIAASVGVGGTRFISYAERGAWDELDLLLWPARVACDLGTAAALLPVESGRAMGYSAASQLALIAGGDAPGAPAASVAALTFDAGTGELSALGVNEGALSEPRAHASVTALGTKLLVAGGENPLRGESEALAPPSASADVFDTAKRRFEAPIALNVERTRHSAIVLAGGDTLLVGGRGPRATPLNVLELVSASSGRASIAGLTSLEVARLSPAVLKLDDGRLFVGGGTAADGGPLAALEWLSGDATQHLNTVITGALPKRHDRAFAALPGGGVLAVGGCQTSEVACGGDCRAGCPPTDLTGVEQAPRYDAWWISPSGVLSQIDLPMAAPRPLLFGGEDGAPLLATGASEDPTLYVFNPWRARFEAADLDIATPPRAGDTATLMTSQAALWIDEEGAPRAFGVRWGTRAHFAVDPALVTSASIDARPAPFPLVPDRAPSDGVHFDSSERILIFDAESEARVFVAGSDYAGLSVELWVEGEAPRIVLGDQEFGGDECPWATESASIFRLERAAGSVVLSADGARSEPCGMSAERARLGFSRGRGAMVIRRISIERSAG